MKSKNQAQWEILKQQVLQKFGDTDKDILEEHFAYIDWKTEESDYHKNKYFRRGRIMRWTALGCGLSSGILAFGIFDTPGNVFIFGSKVLLTLCTIFGPVLIAFYQSSQEAEKNREAWLHHRICLNNYINECLEFSAGVKQYAGKEEKEAKKLLLEKLVSHREENNKKFEESMKQ